MKMDKRKYFHEIMQTILNVKKLVLVACNFIVVVHFQTENPRESAQFICVVCIVFFFKFHFAFPFHH